ncbi:MAG TPA: hypothetical protein VIY86_03715, partial [Pirellulaceae bacterium]
MATERYQSHRTGPGHPECPERFAAVMAGLHRDGLRDHVLWIDPTRSGDPEEAIPGVPSLRGSETRDGAHSAAALCHDPRYLATALDDIKAGLPALSTGDTAVCRESWEIAHLAMQGVLSGIDTVFRTPTRRAFCAVRPPGHHATRDQGMGFCILSNVAIGARYAQKVHGVGKVLIIDWDVHHGNGTQDV